MVEAGHHCGSSADEPTDSRSEQGAGSHLATTPTDPPLQLPVSIWHRLLTPMTPHEEQGSLRFEGRAYMIDSGCSIPAGRLMVASLAGWRWDGGNGRVSAW